MPTRRMLLTTALTAAAAGALGVRSARAEENPWKKLVADYGRVRPPAYRVPLPLPTTLSPTRREADADVYEMTVRAGTAQPLSGKPTPILGFDGEWPGPTVRATRGRAVRLLIKNAIDESVTVHNHGAMTKADSDGHPIDYIRPGASKEYVYPNQQSAGTYWYHDHTMGLTAAHVYRGLAGLYLIDDPDEEALGLPRGEHDLPLMFQDRHFDDDHALIHSVDTGTIFKGFLGNTLCVNGVFTPYCQVAARKYRLRLVNGSNSRNLRLAFADKRALVQIASDGHFLPAPIAMSSIELAPAERADVIVDFSSYAPGTKVVLQNLDETWPTVTEALRFDVTRKERDTSRVPERLPVAPRLEESSATVHRTITMHINDGKWTLNGLRYDPARIDFRPRLGTTEIWTLRNAESTQMHPFHQHLVPFHVLDVDGKPPPLWLQGQKDTVAVGPSSVVRIIMRFTGYTGVYVFHCHKLEHEDHAMMLQQEVIA